MTMLTHFLLATLALGEGTPGDLFSIVLADAGDIDRDGTPDILVSDPVDADRSICAGRVWIVSGKDASVLRTWRGEDGESLGTTLGSTGDVDGDGVPDVFLGASGRRDSERAVWRVASGRTGADIHRFEGVVHDTRSIGGPSFAKLGDVDADDVPDFAIGAASGMQEKEFLGSTIRRSVNGQVVAHSGRTGLEVWRIESVANAEVLGAELVAAGDVDRDGIGDLLISVTHSTKPDECARIVSGKDGAWIRSLVWSGERGYDGPQLAAGTDLEGDGIPDAIVAMGASTRRAVCFSGGDGRTLRTWTLEFGGMYRTVPHFIPDVDGDKTAELVLTSPGSYSERSTLSVHSGALEDKRLLAVGFAPWESTNFACSVLSVPDRDGDGIADLLVGEASQRHHGWLGEARYYSTKTGRVLGSFTRASLEPDAEKPDEKKPGAKK